jgi:hypothetical protein
VRLKRLPLPDMGQRAAKEQRRGFVYGRSAAEK